MKYVFFIFLIGISTSCLSQTVLTQFDSAYIYTYGGSNDDYARQIISTSDSGYIVVGSTSSFGVALSDIYVVKTDKDALRQWSHIYGSPAIELGYAIRETYDNGYIIAGYTNQDNASGYDIYLVKIDGVGNMEWAKTIGGADWDFGYGLELTPDSGFIICGKSYSYSNGGSDVYIVKTNSTGDVVWQKNYGGTNDESANAIIRDRNNDYAIAGETKSYGAGDNDVWVLKINGNGDTLWTRTYGTTLFDAGYAIDTTSDGNYICNGTSYGFRATDTTSDMYFFKIDALGNQLWYQVQGADSSAEEGRVVKELPDGNLFSGGMTESYGLGKTAYYMLRDDNGGNYLNGCAFGGSDYDEGYSVAVGKDNQIVFAGISNSYGCGLYDVYLIRIDTFAFVNEYVLSIHEFCDSTIGIPELTFKGNNISVYPNPASESTHLDYKNVAANSKYNLKIADITGREVISYQVAKFPVEVSVANLQHGIYMIGIYRDNLLEATEKLIVY